MNRLADLISLVPFYAWSLVCMFGQQILRLQTIICHSQYAEVLENGGNVAVLEQWDDVRVEIHRKHFRSGSEPASVENFVELFPVGRIVDANAGWYKQIVRPAQTL
jgi:hypothetical protein